MDFSLYKDLRPKNKMPVEIKTESGGGAQIKTEMDDTGNAFAVTMESAAQFITPTNHLEPSGDERETSSIKMEKDFETAPIDAAKGVEAVGVEV